LFAAEYARAGDDVERRLEAREAGKALGPTVAWNDAEAHFGKGEDRGFFRHAILAGERQFEAAAQGAGVDRPRDGLLPEVEAATEFRRGRRLLRRAELGDVGAGKKARAAADDDRGPDGGIAGDLAETFVQAGPDRLADGIDRRIIDPQQRDLTALLKEYRLRKLRHGVLP